ncbi:MAG TPA: hypothetical protein VE823_08340 [Geodermatophilus sp.]|nr:hypothetical protein [Geodermatophilus sp.]
MTGTSTGERLTWETCPTCGRCAAVGWQDGVPVAIDCPGGCRPSADAFARRAPSAAVPSPTSRWTAAARTWT